jgi:hypothetical protein
MAVVDQLLEHLRAALSEGATPEARAAGAVACRRLLELLEPAAASSSRVPDPAGPAPAQPGASSPPLGGVPPAAAAALLGALPEPVRVFVEALGRSNATAAPGAPAADPLGVMLDAIVGKYGHLLPQEERDRVRGPVAVPMPPWFR